MKHLGDITKINGAEIPVVDCITGGSPCQDLSVAGKRAGLDGERSGLFMEQIRIVKEMRAKEIANGRTGQFIRPRYMVWENVPGAFSSNGGKDFQAVLTEIVRIVEADAPDVPMPDKGKWTKAGCLYGKMGNWSIAWRVHDAQFWGVPQRRKRIALVADFGGLSAPEVLFERKGMSWDSEPCGTERKGTAEAVGNGTYPAVAKCITRDYNGSPCIGDRGWNMVMQVGNGTKSASVGVDVYNQEITGDVAASLTAAVGGTNTSGAKVLQSAEPILLESNQNHATIQTDGISTALPASMGMGGGYVPMVTQSAEPQTVYSLQGGGVTSQNSQGSTICEDVSFTLNATDRHGVCAPNTIDRPAVCAYSFDSLSSNSMKSKNPHSGCRQVEVAKTVDCFDPNPSKNQGGMAVVYDARGNGNGEIVLFEPRSQDGVPRIHGDVSPTLNTAQGGQRQPCVCIENGQADQLKMSEKVGALNCMHDQQAVMVASANGFGGYSMGAGTLRAAGGDHGGGSEMLAMNTSTVRRLTPLECERLQGFPDGWTDIGEWTDTKGKKHQTADSARYKALGNSIALPFWFYLLRRISAQYERPATLGSLFDGIGGFPLCWERCNGQGTAIWASEIEEFPIAVTKRHFKEDA